LAATSDTRLPAVQDALASMEREQPDAVKAARADLFRALDDTRLEGK